MSLSFHSFSLPVMIRALHQLAHVLEKGQQHAVAAGLDQAQLLQSRLAPDMLPLVKQVQIASDMSKNGAARLAGVEPLRMEDNEASFEELQQRIARTIAYLEAFTPAQLEGAEQRAIVLTLRDGDHHFNGHDYLFHFVLPNLYFHCTTAYNLLRQAGAPLGKRDYLGQI